MGDIIERQREIVARHIRGENEHDWATVYDTFVQDRPGLLRRGAAGHKVQGDRGSAGVLRIDCGSPP